MAGHELKDVAVGSGLHGAKVALVFPRVSAVVGEYFDSYDLVVVRCLVDRTEPALANSFVQTPGKWCLFAKAVFSMTSCSLWCRVEEFPLHFYDTDD